MLLFLVLLTCSRLVATSLGEIWRAWTLQRASEQTRGFGWHAGRSWCVRAFGRCPGWNIICRLVALADICCFALFFLLPLLFLLPLNLTVFGFRLSSLAFIISNQYISANLHRNREDFRHRPPRSGNPSLASLEIFVSSSQYAVLLPP